MMAKILKIYKIDEAQWKALQQDIGNINFLPKFYPSGSSYLFYIPIEPDESAYNSALSDANISNKSQHLKISKPDFVSTCKIASTISLIVVRISFRMYTLTWKSMIKGLRFEELDHGK